MLKRLKTKTKLAATLASTTFLASCASNPHAGEWENATNVPLAQGASWEAVMPPRIGGTHLKPLTYAETGWELSRRDAALGLTRRTPAQTFERQAPSLRDATRQFIPATGDRLLIIDPRPQPRYRDRRRR